MQSCEKPESLDDDLYEFPTSFGSVEVCEVSVCFDGLRDIFPLSWFDKDEPMSNVAISEWSEVSGP